MAGAKDIEVVGFALAEKGVAKLSEGEGCGRFVVQSGDDVAFKESVFLRR